MTSSEPPVLQQISEAVERLESLLDRVPEPAAKAVRAKVEQLRKLLLDQRPPALVLVGRRGSGKSSLVNALVGSAVAELGHVKSQTGRGRWFEFEAGLGSLRILDTRGVQEGSAPTEEDDAKNPVASIVGELRQTPPDAVLFLVKATEVDAAIDGDLDALERILQAVEREHNYRPPVLAAVTHCDLLEPKSVRLHQPEGEDPDEVDEKLQLVAEAERLLEDRMRERPALRSELVSVIGISAYMSWRRDGSLRSDERWRVDDLVSFLVTELPEEARLMFVRLTQVEAVQTQLCRTMTQAVAALCGGVASVPIPVADIVPITNLQISLVAAIAYIGGRELTVKAAAEFLSAMGMNVGAAFVLREGARALVKFVFPGAGLAVSAAVAYAGTVAIGEAARAYFISGVDEEEAKRLFTERRKQVKDGETS